MKKIIYKRFRNNQKGTSFIEVVIALALLGIISVAFLSALATTSNTRAFSNRHTAARILATSQMDSIRQQNYSFSYDPVPIPPEYVGFSTDIVIDNFNNGNIQKITVTVTHHNEEIAKLESYKAIR
jgi:prepilin-type N-terminal cleavage/methylation domain-containing protein